jgi:hypothetical protein
MYSNQELTDMNFMYGMVESNAVGITIYIKKGNQDEDVQIGKHL